MNHLLEKIKQKNASAFTHSGKFHADDVFSAALLLYLNPEITITRGNQVPENYEGLVFDIGRGQYDHHQKDSRIRDNGVGIADIHKAMEPLYTSKPSNERSGMGFSFMEAFMDSVTVESEPGKGTTVTMKKKIGR